MTRHSVKWAAEISQVREVSLLGSADLDFWTKRLAKQDLQPLAKHGRAQLLVITADMKFLGVRFREMSFSVAVAPPPGGLGAAGLGNSAAFLAQAFNTCQLFALSERVLFATPYRSGEIRMSDQVPCSVELMLRGQTLFQAEMDSAAPPEPARRANDDWDGLIYVPHTRVAQGDKGRVFVARLRGEAVRFPFRRGQDLLRMVPAFGLDVLTALVDSQFVVDEWLVRTNGRHSKSKTYTRAQLGGLVTESNQTVR